MPRTDEQFHSLMHEVINGSEAAAKELFEDYEPYLLIAIRRRLNRRLRSQFDSLDVAQNVWASFFAEMPDRRVFTSPEELLAFLTSLARNKVVDLTRQKLIGRRANVNREQGPDGASGFDMDHLVGPQPTPSQILMTQEEWGEFLRKQPPVYRRIFILLRDGKSAREIAEELGIEQRMVYRVVQRYSPGGAS